MSAQADSLKSIFFALGANFAIAVAKTAGAVFTGSSTMLAEAIHSYADCGNQALLIWGLREAKRAPTADHPLGFGKAIYFWSFIVALVLFSIGVLLVVVAVLVGVEVKALLVGQSAEPRVVAALRAHVQAQPEVAQLYNLLTQQLGGEIMLAVKARMVPQPSDVALVEAINRVEKSLRDAFPE